MSPTFSKSVRLFTGAVLFACSCFNLFSGTSSSFFQFVNDQGQRQYRNVPHEVLALYYGWYGKTEYHSWGEVDAVKHESTKTAHFPVNGAYSSHDPAVLDWQIDQAKSHGITGFVVSWWGKGDWESWHDQTLALLLERAARKDFKISFYWEHERDTGAQLVQFAVDDLTYALERYGKSKAFLKLDGKPVVFAYGQIQSQTPLSALAEIIEQTRARAGAFVIIGQGSDTAVGWLFDGWHADFGEMRLDWLSNAKPEHIGQFRENAARQYARGAQRARERNRIVCPMIIPGFNNLKSSPARVNAERYDGLAYRALWEEALKTKPDWVLISSWNEWPEATEIEPSVELGSKYLEITAEYSKAFLESPTISRPAPAIALPAVPPGTTNRLDQVLAGKTVCILKTDTSCDAELVANYLGANVRRMSWPDLISTNTFNAKLCPVLLYTGGEHFVGTVKTNDDVISGLVRYLHQGGFLVAVPTSGVWPFYYDQSHGDKPTGTSDKLGFGVTSVWDTPPPGGQLKYCVNKNTLLGLPLTISYPSTGDLRFRPVTRARVPSFDNYVPLVQLWDSQNHNEGDAVVYIEHRTSPLSPGKTIYVSMQTPGAFGTEAFYSSLFQFIATKLK